MPSTRATIASPLASTSILFLGWQAATHSGQAEALPNTTVATVAASQTGSTTSTENNDTTTAEQTAAAAGGDPNTDEATSQTESSTQATTAAAIGSGTWTGTTESNRFGSVTVTITVTDGVITDVSAETLANDHHSEQINSFAVPTLREEVLAAQSADIATVSGATFTSDSSITSLQSALDQVQ